MGQERLVSALAGAKLTQIAKPRQTPAKSNPQLNPLTHLSANASKPLAAGVPGRSRLGSVIYATAGSRTCGTFSGFQRCPAFRS